MQANSSRQAVAQTCCAPVSRGEFADPLTVQLSSECQLNSQFGGFRKHPAIRIDRMNQKKRYISDEQVPEHYYTTTVRGKQLCVDQEVTLERGIGYPAGRYKFCYGQDRDGVFMLTFFGPTARSKQRYREVWDYALIRTVHR